MKTRNKKILAVVLIVCLAFAMVGCGVQGNIEADPNSTTGHLIGAILNFFQSITAKIGLPNYCVAIFILTLLVKLATHPLIVKQQRSMKNMNKLQGKMQDINRRYANNPEKRQEAIMKLYREENINPMSSCLPLLIQMPIIMVLFWGMRNFIPPEGMQQFYSFFWIDSLSDIVSTTPYPYVLPILCAVTTLLQQFVSMANVQDKTQRMMLVIMPVMFLFISMQFPAGLCLYWMFYGIIGAVQTLIVNFQLKIGIFTPAEEKERKKQELAAAKEQKGNNNQKNQSKEVNRQVHTHTHQDEATERKLPDKPWQQGEPMKTVEKSGKTIDIAVEVALSQLGVAREETTIEVLEQPTKGIFGFGAKNALVRVTVIGDDSVADTPGETSTKETAPKAATAGSPDTDPVATAMEFLQNIFEKFELTIDIQVTPGEEFTTLDLVGEDLGILIGRRGETLDALQYLTNLTVSRKYKERHKFILDAEDYRAKRRETLERLAKKLADKVLATNRSVSLEPMSPYERRIIHTVLQDYPGVRTFSEGEEPYRKVVITKKR